VKRGPFLQDFLHDHLDSQRRTGRYLIYGEGEMRLKKVDDLYTQTISMKKRSKKKRLPAEGELRIGGKKGVNATSSIGNLLYTHQDDRPSCSPTPL